MTANEPEPALEIAEGWARMVGGLRDPQLQVGWVREQLARLGPGRAADVLTVVLARAEQREERFLVLLLRASLALSGPDDGGHKRAIACSAEARHQLALARFLGAALEDEGTEPPPSGTQPAPEAALDPAMQRAIASRERPLSLGERKSLARGRDRNVLARVLRDPHPDVVRILLDNPALTEMDVVRMCARRPIAPEVLVQVFRHVRWVLRYRVRRTLALNPYTPSDLAVQLLPHLTAKDVQEVARSGDVSERVRAACSAPRVRAVH